MPAPYPEASPINGGCIVVPHFLTLLLVCDDSAVTNIDGASRYSTLIDPEIAAALTALPLGEMNATSAAAFNAALAAGVVPRPALADSVVRTQHVVPGSTARLRLHRPVGAVGALPCIYWVHGGGYVVGDYEMDDLRLQKWCEQLACCVVAVDYRLAPADPYPAALDDCQAGLHWVLANAAELEIDPTRLGVGGESAGGGLAAALALRERDRGAATFAFQLLLYPMLDDRMTTVSSGWPDPVWSPTSNRYGWGSYVGHLGADVPGDAAPARASDLSALPPTLVAVATPNRR